jgi:hypothetical protein
MHTKLTLLILFIVLSQVLAACGDGMVPVTSTTPVNLTPTDDPFRSGQIVQAFWDALGAGDVETAMSYVDEKVSCGGYCHFTGRRAFESYLRGYLDAGYSTKISDLKAVGSIVTYSWEVHRNGLFLRRGDSDEMMQVEDGLIVYWENQHR